MHPPPALADAAAVARALRRTREVAGRRTVSIIRRIPPWSCAAAPSSAGRARTTGRAITTPRLTTPPLITTTTPRRSTTRRRRWPRLRLRIGITARRLAPTIPTSTTVRLRGSSFLRPLTDMATKPETTNDIKVDPNALYLEEIFTDRRVGTIRRMTPVKKDGNKDAARAVIYQGETQVLTPAGALPIGFDIPAVTLEEAAEKFGQLAREAIERTVKELQEMRRQAASQIVVPQGPIPPLGGAGGGGKIQMP